MDLQALSGVSRKSRGILYLLKNELNKRRQTLREHICDIFGFQKQQFKKKQFFALIKKYDNKLVLSELDQLFDQLDQNRNEKVFLYHLKSVYESIEENDNPNIINRNRVIQKAPKNKNIADIIPVYSEIRKVLLQSDEIIDIIHLFASQNGGYLTKSNLNDILVNLEYKNEKYKSVFLENVIEQNEKIQVQILLEKLDLNQSARRSTIKIPSQQKIIQDFNQSKYIQDILKEEQSLILNNTLIKNSISSDGNDYIQLENTPDSLRPYFNYGSQLEPIFAHFARQYIETKSTFIDTQNPSYSRAYQWIHLAELGRQYFLFQMAKSVLSRQRNRRGLGLLLQPKDIIQGNLGDCYFLSAVAGVVEKYPELVYRLFVLQKNPSHIYGVRLFVEGIWKTVILDACFPVDRYGRFCAAQPHHQQIWVLLLQKAWAKVYGSYDNIHSGYNQQGLNSISGAPSIYVSAQQNEFVKRLEVQINRGSIITMATSPYVNMLSQLQQQKSGIFANHAYSILNVYSNIKVKDNEVTLIKIRNPWGKKEWQGRCSFKSDFWTPALREKFDYKVDPQDGSFFMMKEDLILHFDHVNICRVNLANKNSWIQINADRQQFKIVKIRITEKGDYYFTLYQENPRRYSGKVYEKSKSMIFLFEQKNGRVQAIGSCSKDRRDNTLQVSLEKGQYRIISKIQWKLWEKHQYTLSSYGPQRVKFNLKQEFNIHFLSDFIESKAKLGFGKKSFYGNHNILKRVQFSPQQGYGFILINNQQNKIFDIQITFQNHKGLTILPPYSLPISLKIFPGEQVICKFLVDPAGYAYSLKENYKFLDSF